MSRYVDLVDWHDGVSGPAGVPRTTIAHDGQRTLEPDEVRMTVEEYRAQQKAWDEAWARWWAERPPEPSPPPPPAPSAVTRRQLRLWLVKNDYRLERVETLIDALPEPQRTEARIEWQDATLFERNHPLLQQLAGALFKLEGKALEEVLDMAFREAAAL